MSKQAGLQHEPLVQPRGNTAKQKCPKTRFQKRFPWRQALKKPSFPGLVPSKVQVTLEQTKVPA